MAKPWERDWTQPAQPAATPLPISPLRAREEARKDNADARANDAAARAAEAAARQAAAQEQANAIAVSRNAREQAQFQSEQARGGLTPVQMNELKDAQNTLRFLKNRIDELDTIYRRSFAGKGLQSVAEYAAPAALRPDNANLNTAASSSSAMIARALGLTGQQFNTPAEAEMFIGGMLPKNTDPDEVIVSKINRIKDVYEGGQRAIATKLGQPYTPTFDPETGAAVQQDDIAVMPRDVWGRGGGGGGGSPATSPVPFGQTTRRVNDPAASAEVDRMIRSGVPYEQANAWALSQGLPALDPQAYAANLDFIRQNPGYRDSTANIERDDPMSGIEILRNSALNNPVGAAAAAGVNATTAGLLNNIPSARRSLDALQSENPTSSFIGDIAGSVGGVGAMARYGPQVLSRAGGMVGDALYGTVRGASEARPGEATAGAIYGGGAALGGGLLGRAVGYGAGRAGQTEAGQAVVNTLMQGGNRVANAGRALIGRNPQAAAKFAPPVRGAEGIVVNSIPDVDDARRQLQFAQQNNIPMGLADLSNSPRMMAGAAFRNASPTVQDQFGNIIDQRSRGQAERAVEQINRNFGPTANPPQLLDRLQQQARDQSRPFYEAFEAEPARSSQLVEQILATPAGKGALKRAWNNELNTPGGDPRKMGFDLDQEGNVVLVQQPSPRTLDFVKKALDDEAYVATRSGSAGQTEIGQMKGLARQFREELDQLYPGTYKSARESWAGPTQAAEAFETGRGALNMRPYDMEAARGQVGAGQVPMFDLGARTSMVDAVNRQRFSGNPYEQIVGSPEAMARARMLDPGGADNMARVADVERAINATRNEVLGGSPTQPRQFANEQLRGEVGGLGTDTVNAAIDMSLTGAPVRALAKVAQGMGRRARDANLDRKVRGKADDIVPMLLETDPGNAQRILQTSIKRDRELGLLIKDYLDRYTRRVGMFGSGVGAASAGYGLSGQ